MVVEAIAMFDRITGDPRQMGGVPCIRGLRIPVSTIVGMIADGMSSSEILDAYPDLESDDIVQALLAARVPADGVVQQRAHQRALAVVVDVGVGTSSVDIAPHVRLMDRFVSRVTDDRNFLLTPCAIHPTTLYRARGRD